LIVGRADQVNIGWLYFLDARNCSSLANEIYRSSGTVERAIDYVLNDKYTTLRPQAPESLTNVAATDDIECFTQNDGAFRTSGALIAGLRAPVAVK